MSSYKKEDPGDILVCENSGIEEETANRKEEAWKQVANRLLQRDCSIAGRDNFVIILFFKHLTFTVLAFIEIMQGEIYNQRFGLSIHKFIKGISLR